MNRINLVQTISNDKVNKSISWLPYNSKMEIYILDDYPLIDFEKNSFFGKTTSVFVFAFSGDNIALLKHTDKNRGYDIPGGHVEDESLLEAIKRETMEEIGSTIKNIQLIGSQKIIKDEPEPGYPDLVSNQIFFQAEIDEIITNSLEEDSQGLIFIKKEEFLKYLWKNKKEYEIIYKHIFNI